LYLAWQCYDEAEEKVGRRAAGSVFLEKQASPVASLLSHNGYRLHASTSSVGILPRSFLLIVSAHRNSASENTIFLSHGAQLYRKVGL